MPEKRIRVIHIAECIGGVDRFLRCLMKYSDKDKFENIMILHPPTQSIRKYTLKIRKKLYKHQ